MFAFLKISYTFFVCDLLILLDGFWILLLLHVLICEWDFVYYMW